MQYVLHLTEMCNFACDYCGVGKSDAVMDSAVIFSVVDAAIAYARRARQASTCISFYGGEPLLCKDKIIECMNYASAACGDSGIEVHYRITTNGSLIDEDFLRLAREGGIKLALSIDGTREAHDLHRRDRMGAPTFDAVYTAARVALKALPSIPAMMTINPDTTPMLYESVRFLFDSGFQAIVMTPNLAAEWTEDDVAALGAQYVRVADWYADMLLRGEKIKLPLFDNKLVGKVLPEADEGKCLPGARKISIAVDGSIYPCTQYVRHPRYKFGVAGAGGVSIEAEKLEAFRREATGVIEGCEECALNRRCDNRCGCRNLASSISATEPSPALCAHERTLIPIADALGEKIFL